MVSSADRTTSTYDIHDNCQGKPDGEHCWVLDRRGLYWVGFCVNNDCFGGPPQRK